MASQQSHILNEPVDEEWQLVPAQWWRTSFNSVSWSYEPEKASRNVVCAKPPHYHLSLYNSRKQTSFDDEEDADEPPKTPSEWRSHSMCRIAEADDALNQDLIGVKNASDILRVYEQAVGFDYSPLPDRGFKDLENGEKLRSCVLEEDVKSGKERWDELVDDLFGGMALETLLKEAREKLKVSDASAESLAPPNSTIDYFSRPSTPKPFQLNPSASSFVPLGSPTSTFSSSSCSSLSSDSSDPIGSFSFPSLMLSFPPPPNSKKDHPEYVTRLHTRSRTTSSDGSSVASNERASSSFLPSFLFDSASQRRRPTRTSRTRAIVDQLRSQHQQDGTWTLPVSQSSSPTVSDFGVNNLSYFKSRLTMSDGSSVCSTPPLAEEEFQHLDRAGAVGWSDNFDGWTVPLAPAPVDPETKRTRSKELLMTLRRRTDSLTSNANTVANLAAARSIGAVPVSATPSILAHERLVESPRPIEDTPNVGSNIQAPSGEDERGWSNRSNQCASPPSYYRHMVNVPSAPPRSLVPDTHTSSRGHAQQDSTMQHRTANIARHPQGYYANPAPGLPHNLLGHPVPVSSVPANMGVPMTMVIGATRGGMQVPATVPIQVPVQTVQYSTLMHLRIMQQMQMMRNNMGMGPGALDTSTGATR